MMSKFPLLSPEDCDEIVAALNKDDGVLWRPGESPSDIYSGKVKRNKEQWMGNEAAPATNEAGKYIVDALMQCDFFTRRTLPKHLGRPRFNLSEDGGEYGKHADSAFMGQNPEIRTDLSMTLWLTDPDTYEGGELVMEYASGATFRMKEPKGTVVFYPSGVMHHTLPVTSGQRICFIAWVESHIQDPQKRDLLVEITNVCEEMEQSEHNLGSIHTKMLNIKHNLFRQWMGKA